MLSSADAQLLPVTLLAEFHILKDTAHSSKIDFRNASSLDLQTSPRLASLTTGLRV